MRASYVSNLTIQDQYSLTGDTVHHLVNVIRLEVGEELLLLNGKGLAVTTIVENISKKNILLKLVKSETHGRRFDLDLVLGMPKREALELSLKEAVELGFRRIYLIRSSYSQQRFLDSNRLDSLLVSSLEQSNGLYIPEVFESGWDDVPWEEYFEILILDSQTKDMAQKALVTKTPRLLVVGPEGGFSPQEIGFLHKKNNARILSLPTPILRTPTAVAAGAGVILQTLLD